ncbi:hypothetical protein V2I93_18165 [Pseudomonas viridiflava]|uniref:hypothetical protein n=1 Tax=Pseudomonas viridiflava TaxID=33069 RepID=UPI000F01A360|nr:hypothetical protein [Pseudomonas viridiflava]MEE4223047.1 hypothetical protein [Pseudomonas viridiflava]
MYNNIIIPILLTFFSTLGLVAFTYKTFKKKPLFIRTPNWKFNYKPVDWKLLDYSAAMTTSTILILFYLLLFQELGFNINQTLARIVIAGICISALSMAVLYFKLIDQYKKISTSLGVIATLTTIVLTVICSALADSEIEHLTGAEAGKFPIAQKALTLTAVAAAWAYIIFWINLAATIIVIAYLFFKTGPTNSNGLNFQDQHGRTPYHAFNMLAGVIFLSLTYSNGVIAVFEDLSARRTKDWLVKSSFHQPPERCGVKEKPMDSLIALIGDDKAVLATSSLTELYRFNIISCTEAYKSTPAY